MRGTMMDFPLTLPTILERSSKIFHRVEIVSRKPDKSIIRTCYGEFYRRARRLAALLTKLSASILMKLPASSSRPATAFY